MRALAAGGPRFAEAVAKALDEEIRNNIEQGRGPDGEKWAPIAESATRPAGGRPLRNAGDALEVKAVGDVVIARVSGHHANHHKGKTRGAIARPIIPSKRLSAPAVKAIERALGDTFQKIVSGDDE